jgi:hypothetical protein
MRRFGGGGAGSSYGRGADKSGAWPVMVSEISKKYQPPVIAMIIHFHSQSSGSV